MAAVVVEEKGGILEVKEVGTLDEDEGGGAPYL